MTNIKKLSVAVLIVVLASCASTYKAKVGFDKNANIETSNYKTFAWLIPGKIMAPAEDINPVMKVRVDEEIEQAFIAKGYQLVVDAEQADFTISYTVGNRDKIKQSYYPSTYGSSFGWGGGYYGGHYGGYYGGLSNGYLGTENRIRQYTQGKLAIDVYDVKTHQPAWHGWATKRLKSDDKEAPSSAIKDVVSEVVAQFN